MLRLTLLLLSALAALGSASTGYARDWYVDNVAGDNRWDGSVSKRQGDIFGPLRDIRMALHRATAGDRIVLIKNDEPYRECISLVGNRHSGTVFSPFIIEGNNAILDGSQATGEFDWQPLGGDLYRLPLSESASQILFLDGIPALRAPTLGPLRQERDLPPRSWRLETGALVFRAERNKLPIDYKPSIAKHPTGITLYKVNDVIVRDVIVQGYQIDGIQAHDAGTFQPLVIAGVTARGNGRSGIAVVGASAVAIDGCLVGDNGESQLLVSGPADSSVTNSRLLDNTGPMAVIRGGGVLKIDGQNYKKE
jgi:hypothetical protein